MIHNTQAGHVIIVLNTVDSATVSYVILYRYTHVFETSNTYNHFNFVFIPQYIKNTHKNIKYIEDIQIFIFRSLDENKSVFIEKIHYLLSVILNNSAVIKN